MIRLLPALALTAACRDHHEWRQELTLTVATPDGPRTGAAVVEVEAWSGQLPLSGNEVEYRVAGEATVWSWPPGRILFALLGGSEERFYRAARDRFEGLTRGEWLARIPRQTVPVELTGKSIPLLVTFADIADPASVIRVAPEDLDAAFGCDRAGRRRAGARSRRPPPATGSTASPWRSPAHRLPRERSRRCWGGGGGA